MHMRNRALHAHAQLTIAYTWPTNAHTCHLPGPSNSPISARLPPHSSLVQISVSTGAHTCVGPHARACSRASCASCSWCATRGARRRTCCWSCTTPSGAAQWTLFSRSSSFEPEVVPAVLGCARRSISELKDLPGGFQEGSRRLHEGVQKASWTVRRNPVPSPVIFQEIYSRVSRKPVGGFVAGI
eukprot:365703-Chlamydomonas_euryale.AAC.1